MVAFHTYSTTVQFVLIGIAAGLVRPRGLYLLNKIKSTDAVGNLFHMQKFGEYYFWLSGMLT